MHRVRSATSETTCGYQALLGGAALPEFDRNKGAAVGADLPCCRHVAVRTEDVRLVIGAVHEHRVELRVADPAGPPSDVLADLVAEMTREVAADAVVMLKCDARGGELGGLSTRDCGQTRVPRQRRQVVARAVLVDESLLRGADCDLRPRRRRGGGGCVVRRRSGGTRRAPGRE